MRWIFGIFLFNFIFVAQISKGQGELLESADFENVIQNILPQQEYDVDYNDLYDRLFSLYVSPINLNEADRADLQSLFFLNEEQISGIIGYRQKYGEFKTIFELMAIEGFDRESVERLQKFVRIDTAGKVKLYQSLNDPNIHELFLRYQSVLEQKKGYTPPDTLNSGRVSSRYAGGPARLYGRYLFAKPKYYSFGFTMEKDSGEKLIWDPLTKRYGMDYYSFHGMLENVWKFNKVIVGDFSMGFGQGLVFGSGIRIGKGTEPVTTIRRSSLGLRPYRSVYESKDYSGLAISTTFNSINFNLFASNVARDAKLMADENDEIEPFISYINEVGLHRTTYEIDSKHSISDRSIGGNVNTKLLRSRLEIGLNAVYNQFSAPLFPDQKQYRLFQFTGKSNYNASSYVNYYFKKGHLFQEVAISKSGGRALSSGLIISLSSHIQTAIHYRNYSKDYHAFSNNAFGENISNSNEEGLYWGISIRPVDKLLLNGYFDYFSFPWLKYRVDAPSKGRDFMGSIIYFLDNKTTLNIQFRSKLKSENMVSESEPIVDIHSKKTMRFRLDIDHNITKSFSLKSWIRSTKAHFELKKSRGFMLAQDVSFNNRILSLTGRFAIFDSDDYDSRLYIYERDLLYVYSVPSFNNRGVRYYLMGRVNFSKGVSLWLKCAQTKYFNVDKVGTGLEEIEGNTRTNISFQMKIRLNS